MCDNRTVTPASWSEIGDRVREARSAAGLTQAELGRRTRLDRTAVAKIEAGHRHISALELYRLSDELRLPLAHFVLRPPAAIVSRRTPLVDEPDAAVRSAYYLDADLAAHSRDADWLVGEGYLRPDAAIAGGTAATPADARALARQARTVLGAAGGPLGDMAAVCETFALYVLPVDRDAEGASLQSGRYGVAVIGAKREPGRRRWTAAHELGHHLLGDAYHSDVGVAASEREREAVVDAFAGELLLPDAVIEAEWSAGPEDPRIRLTRLAGRYRLSWSATVLAAARVGVLTGDQARGLRADTATRGDFQEVLGTEPAVDLRLGETGPAWQAAVLAAWRAAAITAPRTVELLHGRLGPDDLPRRPLPPLAP